MQAQGMHLEESLDVIERDSYILSLLFLTCLLRKRRRTLYAEKVSMLLGNVSETPTPTTCLKKYGSTPPICTAVRPPFVSPYFPGFEASKKGKPCNTPPICTAVRLPFVRQYAPHLYGNTFGKILGVGVTGTFLSCEWLLILPCGNIWLKQVKLYIQLYHSSASAFKPSPLRFTCTCFTPPLCLYWALVLRELVIFVSLLGTLLLQACRLVAFILAFTMCDYSLTSNPAQSDMPTEAEPWQPVDVSEVEEKMQKLSTTPVEPKVEAAPPSPPAPQEEVDFGSEPEELLLKGPLVSTASALPTSTPSVQDLLLLLQHLLLRKLYQQSQSPIHSLRDLRR